jgi:hypothetical protein
MILKNIILTEFKLNFENVFDTELHKTDLNQTAPNNAKNEVQALQIKLTNDKIMHDKINQEIEQSKQQKTLASNEEILNKEFQIQSPVSETDLATIVNNLEDLNLHNCSLSNLDTESFKNLINLKKLVLSFNNLKNIKEIVHLVC